MSQQEEQGKKEVAANDAGSTRRDAFVKLGVGSLCVACSGAAVFGYEFLSPNVLYEPSPVANAGKPDRSCF